MQATPQAWREQVPQVGGIWYQVDQSPERSWVALHITRQVAGHSQSQLPGKVVLYFQQQQQAQQQIQVVT
jgi:hypothetical protein